MSLEQWSWIAAILGSLVAIVGFPFLIWQLFVARAQRREAIQLSTSQFLFAADGVLATHADVNIKLRPGGDWAGDEGNIHPTNSELPLVEPYMGVFERIFKAYRFGQVDANTLNNLYGYRLANIWANNRIVDTKLQNDRLKYYWSYFIALTYVLEAQRGERFPLHKDEYFPQELFDRRSARRILEARNSKQPLRESSNRERAAKN